MRRLRRVFPSGSRRSAARAARSRLDIRSVNVLPSLHHLFMVLTRRDPMRRRMAIASTLSLVLGLAPIAASAATIPLSPVPSGDLVRGQSFSAVYYVGKDG